MGLSQKHRNDIRQGFRTGGNLLLGFATAILIVLGTIALSGGDTGRFTKVQSLAAYAVGIAILYWKAKGYSGWIAGFFGIPAAFNSIQALISGHALNQPDVPVSTTEVLFVLIFSLLLIALTFPFTKARNLDRLSRLYIVLAVLAFFFALVNQPRIYGWMTICLVFFGLAALRALSRKELRALGLLRRHSATKTHG